MGLLDRLFKSAEPPKRKAKTPKPFTVDSFLADQSRKILKRMAKEDPETIKQIIISELAARRNWDLAKAKAQKDDPLANYQRVKKQIEELKEDDSDRGWLKEVIPGALQLLVEFQRVQLAQTQGITVVNPNQPTQLPAGQQVALPAGNLQQHEVDMSLVSEFLIGQLKKKTPEQAAAWLLKRKEPQAIALVNRIKRTPEERLPELLSELSSANPALAPFVAWLRARSGWLLDTVRLLQGEPTDRRMSPGL